MDQKVNVKIKVKMIAYEEVELGDEELQTIERTLEILDQVWQACTNPDLRIAFAKMCNKFAEFKEKYIDNGFEVNREIVYK